MSDHNTKLNQSDVDTIMPEVLKLREEFDVVKSRKLPANATNNEQSQHEMDLSRYIEKTIYLKRIPIGTHHVSIIYLVVKKSYVFEIALEKEWDGKNYEEIYSNGDDSYDSDDEYYIKRLKTIEEVNAEIDRLKKFDILYK